MFLFSKEITQPIWGGGLVLRGGLLLPGESGCFGNTGFGFVLSPLVELVVPSTEQEDEG